MNEKGKNPPDQTNEEEIGSLPEKEFRVIIVKMIQNLGSRMEKIQETFNKDLEELKSKETVMNNTIRQKYSPTHQKKKKMKRQKEGYRHRSKVKTYKIK